MGNKLAFAFLLFFSACISDADLTGFIRSTDRVNERVTQSLTWNSTHPEKTIVSHSSAYTLLFAGDSHVGDTINTDNFIKKTFEDDVLAYAMVGDLTTGKEEDYQTFYSCIAKYDSIPGFFIAGNHELYFDGWKHYFRLFGSSTYTFVIQTPSGNDLFICLDNASGTIGNIQLDWLKKIFKERRAAYRNCFVLCHVNFYRANRTASTNPLVEELYVLLDLFANNNVNAVIMGHDHSRSIEVFGNTSYITLDGLLDENPKASYLRFKVEDTGTFNYLFITI